MRKTSFLLAIIAALGASGQPSFAKAGHDRARGLGLHISSPRANAKPPIHASRAKTGGAKTGDVKTGGAKAPNGTGDAPKPAGPEDAAVKDTIEAPGTLAPARPVANPGGANAKTGVPENSPLHRSTIATPVSPLPRNAIGVAVAPHQTISADAGHPAAAPPPAVPPTAASGAANSTTGLGGLAHPNVGSLGSTSIPGRGKIDGTGLVRSSSASSSLGGPAKVVAGINGTTIRTKR